MAFCRSHNGPAGHLGGINKAAWGARLLPTSTSACAMIWAHCGHFCQLLSKQLGCLGLKFPGPTHPPHPLIHDTHDITQSFQKPAISASCPLCSCNASYKTGVLLVHIWRGYNQASVNCSILNISNSDFLKYKMRQLIRSVFLNLVTCTQLACW